MENDGECSNVRIWNNEIHDVHFTGFPWLRQKPAPYTPSETSSTEQDAVSKPDYPGASFKLSTYEHYRVYLFISQHQRYNGSVHAEQIRNPITRAGGLGSRLRTKQFLVLHSVPTQKRKSINARRLRLQSLSELFRGDHGELDRLRLLTTTCAPFVEASGLEMTRFRGGPLFCQRRYRRLQLEIRQPPD